jgi:hypothetical protein
MYDENSSIYPIRVNGLEISIVNHHQANNSINQYSFIYSLSFFVHLTSLKHD